MANLSDSFNDLRSEGFYSPVASDREDGDDDNISTAGWISPLLYQGSGGSSGTGAATLNSNSDDVDILINVETQELLRPCTRREEIYTSQYSAIDCRNYYLGNGYRSCDDDEPLLGSDGWTEHNLLTDDSLQIGQGRSAPLGTAQGGGQRNVRKRNRTASHSSLIDVDRFVPLTLSWSDLSIKVNIPAKKKLCFTTEPSKEKTILKNVSGLVSPGSLLAIVGASGSGKSTLLNALTMRNVKDYKLSGDIRVNGWKVDDGIKNVSAYVQQNDLFISTLTVREQLQFRAQLRMDQELSKEDRFRRVEEVIIQMGLSDCADVRIGIPSGTRKGISGGERKRLSFASEVLTNPAIFFCDEPTSSLDTFMAQSVVHVLRKMAYQGRTVLCTIHQPSSELFTMFNQILLLSEGRVAFMGSTDDAITFFNRLGYPCPVNFNPADHYIMTLAVVPEKEEESRRKIKSVCDSFKESSQAKYISSKTTQLVAETRNVLTEKHLDLVNELKESENRYAASWFCQFTNLFMRSWKSQVRDTVLFNVRIMQALSVALIVGLIYLQLNVDQKGVMNINGALFLLITNVSLSNMFAVLASFPIEMAIIMREYGTGLYRMDTYYFSKTLSEIPLFSMICFMFCTITYWMIGFFDHLENFFVAAGVLILTAMVSVSVGYMVSVVCGTTTVALAVTIPIIMPFLLFGGMFINNDSTPAYFIWLKFSSWYRYAYEIMMINQWRNIHTIDCDNRYNNITRDMSLEEVCQAKFCMYRSGDDVLKYLSFKEEHLWFDVVTLCGLLVLFYTTAFVALLLRARRSKE